MPFPHPTSRASRSASLSTSYPHGFRHAALRSFVSRASSKPELITPDTSASPSESGPHPYASMLAKLRVGIGKLRAVPVENDNAPERHTRRIGGMNTQIFFRSQTACAIVYRLLLMNSERRELMPAQNALNRFLIAALAVCAMAVPIAAQSIAPGYDLPPKNILDVMRAPSPPVPDVSPTHDAILLISWQDYPSIARVATAYLRLAGVRVEPKNHSKHDTPGGYGITPCARDFELVHVADAARIHIALPAGACPNAPTWSADG